MNDYKIQTYEGQIKFLKAREIFVFGSNLQGFHGAGAAGFATFGVLGNQWRKFEYDKKLKGWKGLWTVKGVGEGLQQGTNGWSYALPTVTRPGAKKSLSEKQIQENIKKMYDRAYINPSWKFFVAYSEINPDKANLNGYTTREIARMFFNAGDIPKNVLFEETFAKLIGEIYEDLKRR